MATGGYEGSCLCGAVAFEITGEPWHFVICHCSNCKQSGGGPFQANAFFKPEQVTISRGKDVVKDYTDGKTKSGNTITRSFCSNCGSSLFIIPAVSNILIVHAASIKGSDKWVPKKESFGEEKWKWIEEITFQPKKASNL